MNRRKRRSLESIAQIVSVGKPLFQTGDKTIIDSFLAEHEIDIGTWNRWVRRLENNTTDEEAETNSQEETKAAQEDKSIATVMNPEDEMIITVSVRKKGTRG